MTTLFGKRAVRLPQRNPGVGVRVLTGVVALLLGAIPAGAEPPVDTSRLYAELRGVSAEALLAEADPTATVLAGLAWQTPADPPPTGPKPFVAGLMSAVIPGSGQLAQKKNRGWIYLGVEVASWFAYFALDSAGDQAEQDYSRFAEAHWDWERYATVVNCGDGLGPVDFEQESEELAMLAEENREAFLDEIGRNDVYACGWDEQGNRSAYVGKQQDADDLYGASRIAGTVIFLNHVVSAVDAAKVSADRHKQAKANEPELSWNWRVQPARGGVALRVRVDQRF